MDDIKKETLEDGTVVYYIGDRRDNIFHHEDGPAIKSPNGDEYWYYEGVRHRDDGPAVKDRWGEEWYLFGQRISQNKFHEYKNAKPAVKDRWGEEWYLFGQRIPQNKFHEYKNAKRNTEK